jgi:hypothetical protein
MTCCSEEIKNIYEDLQLQWNGILLKNVNNCFDPNIYSYLETPGGQSYNLYLNVDHFFNDSVN